MQLHSIPDQRAERQLVAVVAADIAGYSRPMGADEEGTLARLKACRRDLIDPGLARHRGRIVKTTGDGLLIEFSSPVEAVRWAVETQQGMIARNADVPEDRRGQFLLHGARMSTTQPAPLDTFQLVTAWSIAGKEPLPAGSDERFALAPVTA